MTDAPPNQPASQVSARQSVTLAQMFGIVMITGAAILLIPGAILASFGIGAGIAAVAVGIVFAVGGVLMIRYARKTSQRLAAEESTTPPGSALPKT